MSTPVESPRVPLLDPGETVRLASRRSWEDALQLPSIVLVVLGMGLFYEGNQYLTSHLIGIILGTVSIKSVALWTLAAYVSGYVLIALGTWGWSRILPPLLGGALLALVLVVPLVMFATWFSVLGTTTMLGFFAVFALLLPLVLSVRTWTHARYALTDRRVVAEGGPLEARITSSLPREEVRQLSRRPRLLLRPWGVADIAFGKGREPGAPEDVEWRGVARASGVVSALEAELKLTAVRGRRPRRHVLVFLGLLGVIGLAASALMLAPVLTQSTTLDLHCALYLSSTTLESDPWPYIHNETLPVGDVSFRWYSGSAVYLVLGQLPVGISYQNTNIDSLEPANQAHLTSAGSGSFTSYGGESFAACIGTSSNAEVTLTLTHPSPVLWE